MYGNFCILKLVYTDNLKIYLKLFLDKNIKSLTIYKTFCFKKKSTIIWLRLAMLYFMDYFCYRLLEILIDPLSFIHMK